jgi:hypothetical protein
MSWIPTEDEDSKLTSAVQTVGGNKWVAIALLVPGRTKAQCHSRWNCISISTIDPTTARLEEPLLPPSTTTDEAAGKTGSPEISEGLSPPVVDHDNIDSNA